MRGRRERGQALVETVIFLPVALIALFGIIYFSRNGVLAERAQGAVRYGALVSYATAPVYSAADMYGAIAAGGAARSTACPANVQPDTIKALSEQNGSGATPSPYWRPDTATATCAATTLSFSGPPWAAFHVLAVTSQTATATTAVPPFLTKMLGSTADASATFGYVRSLSPSAIMYCTGSGPEIAAAMGFSYSGGGSC